MRYLCILAFGLVLASGVGFAQVVQNPGYDIDGTLNGWSTAMFNPGWGSGPELFYISSSQIGGDAARSAPNLAKTEWSGHNEGRNASVFQNLSGGAGQEFTVEVWGQCVTTAGPSSLSLRAADGHTATWNTGTPPGSEIDSVAGAASSTWTLLSGTFTPAGADWQIGATWIAGGSGAPWSICAGSVDDWSVSPTSAVDDWALY